MKRELEIFILVGVIFLANCESEQIKDDTTLVHGQFVGFGEYQENLPIGSVGEGLTIPSNGGSIAFNAIQSTPKKVIGNGLTIPGEQGIVTGSFDGFGPAQNNEYVRQKRQQGGFRRPNGFDRQGGFNDQNFLDRQNGLNLFRQQGGFRQQEDFGRQGGFNQQNGFRDTDRFPQLGGFGPQGEFNQQNNFPERGFRQQGGVQQGRFFQQGDLREQRGFNRENRLDQASRFPRQGDFIFDQQNRETTTPASTIPTTASPQYLNCLANCPTTNEYNPVCGSDTLNYHNSQKLTCAQNCGKKVQQLRLGTCLPL